MKNRFLCLCFVVLLCLSANITVGDDRARNEKTFDLAVNAWRQGDVTTAHQLLTELSQTGSEDPRVYYYRGILDELSGKDGAADFTVAARLEAEGSRKTIVNRSLEKTQGPIRAKIEKARAVARNALKADPEAERLKLVYREALEARGQGDLKTALTRLEEITATGKDPRYFYMKGVTLAETGNIEKARAAFADGLKFESTPQDTQLVSIALAGVQGEIRRIIEEETIVQVGDASITRQANSRDIRRKAVMTQDQILAEANAETVAAAERERQKIEERRLAAAEAIMAENKAKQELEDKVAQRPVVALADTNSATPPAEEMPAEPATTEPTEPEPSDAPASDNPFLAGGGTTPMAAGAKVAPVSSVTAGPVDMSYLPPATELLIYARPADMLNSGFVKPLTDMPQFQVAITEMASQTGMAPADIDSVTMGMGNLIATMIPLMTRMSAGPPDGAALTQQLMGGENVMVVIRTVKDIDSAQLAQSSGGTEATHEGKSYFLIPKQADNQPQMAMHAIDARTYLFSSEPGIKAAISNGPGSAENEQFAFVSRSSHMVQAFSSPLLAGMSAGIPDPQGAPPQVAQFVSAIKGKITGGAIVLNAGSDLKLDISLNLIEDSAATEANTALSGGLMMAKQMAPFAFAQAPPALQPYLGEAAYSLTSSSNDTAVTATVTVPGGIVQVLKDNPELLGPIAAARNAAQTTEQNNRLKQIGLAMHNYHDTYKSFPAADGNGLDGEQKKSGLSWRVHLLPFMEQAQLYSQFNLDEPWDSEHNKALIPQMPETYRVFGIDTPGDTTIHVFTGANTLFDPAAENGPSIRMVIDGTSNVIMAVTAGPETAAPWTKPGGLPFDAASPLTALGTVAETISVLLCDGSVRSISSRIDQTTFANLIQPADGNIVEDF